MRVHIHEGLGLSFELPANWLRKARQHDGLVFWGPKSSPAQTAAFVIQPVGPASQPLHQALVAAYAKLGNDVEIHWDYLEPAIVAGRTAWRYGLQFERQEIVWRKAGVVMSWRGSIFDISCGGASSVFPHAVVAYESAVASLALF